MNEATATEPQIKAIYAIGRGQHSWNEGETDEWCMQTFRTLPSALSKKQASNAIDALKRMAGGDAAAQPSGNIQTNRVIEMAPERRERLIVRQSSLKAALDFCCPAGRGDAELPHIADVLSVAEQFEAWVLR